MMLLIVRGRSAISLVVLTVVSFCHGIEPFLTVPALPKTTQQRTSFLGRSKNGRKHSHRLEKIEYEPASDWKDQPEESWRYDLPPQLQRYPKRTLDRIECTIGDGTELDVYIMGTIHVWNESARDVRLLLETLCPDLIMIESDHQGFQAYMLLHFGFNYHDTDPKASNFTSILDSWTSESTEEKKRWRWGPRHRLSPSERRQENFGKELRKSASFHNSVAGGEFLTAIQYWNNVHSTRYQQASEAKNVSSTASPFLVLGDRPIDLTFSRVVENSNKRERIVNFLTSCFTPRFRRTTLFTAVISGMACAALHGTGFGMAKTVSKSIRNVSLVIALLSICVQFQSPQSKRLKVLFGDLLDDTPGAYRRIVALASDPEQYYRTIMYNGNVSTAINEACFLGTENEVLLHERDRYMACKLFHSVCGAFESFDADGDNGSICKRHTAIAVVGAGHVAGMSAFFHDLLREKEDPSIVLPSLVESPLYEQQHGEEQVKQLINEVDWQPWLPLFGNLQSNYDLEPHKDAS